MRVLPLFALLSIAPAYALPGDLHIEAHAFRAGDITVDAELGRFTVPQRHDQPDGPRFTLQFVRLPRLSSPAGADQKAVAPIVYLAGGPGGSGIEAGRGPRLAVFQEVRKVAAVILLDQRGTGLSDPAPRCPEKWSQPPEQATEVDVLRKELNQLALRCAAFWKSKGMDLQAYNSVESAHDLEALRKALDVPKLNLWGMSYGTHLAMATLRSHEDSIERVLLMGTEGLHQTYKPPLQADRLLERLARQLPQSADTAKLLPRIKRVLDRLRDEPVLVEFPADSGMPPKVLLSAFDLQLATALGLATTATSRELPAAYAAMEQGDFSVAAMFVVQIRARFGSFNAMSLAMDLASGASPERLRQIAKDEKTSLLGPALNFPFPQIGAGLGVTDLGEDFRAPLKTKVPTLFVSGTLDGRTPPENVEDVRSGFSNSTHLILDGAGHDNELFLATPDFGQRIAAFFAGKKARDETLVTPMW